MISDEYEEEDLDELDPKELNLKTVMKMKVMCMKSLTNWVSWAMFMKTKCNHSNEKQLNQRKNPMNMTKQMFIMNMKQQRKSSN